ncbi:MAG: ATP synthase F1 subunit gamma [Candidatus Eiseniibacteriota bacterium]
MATLRDIKRRIRSVRSTQQITKAMELVAAAKLRKAQVRALQARPYAQGMEDMLRNLGGTLSAMQHPLAEVRPVKARALVVFASNRGFAGSYNANLVRTTESLLRGPEGSSLRLVLIGRKVGEYFRRRSWPIAHAYTDLPDQAEYDVALRVTQKLVEMFRSGEVDAVDLVYSQFVSAMTRRVVRETLLPIGGTPAGTSSAAASGAGSEAEAGKARDYIFEPGAPELVGRLLPRYATTRVLQAFAEAYASEHSARMLAMGSARKNAGDLIDSLVLKRNRLRQASITKEISEIVGGAEALK